MKIWFTKHIYAPVVAQESLNLVQFTHTQLKKRPFGFIYGQGVR